MNIPKKVKILCLLVAGPYMESEFAGMVGGTYKARKMKASFALLRPQVMPGGASRKQACAL